MSCRLVDYLVKKQVIELPNILATRMTRTVKHLPGLRFCFARSQVLAGILRDPGRRSETRASLAIERQGPVHDPEETFVTDRCWECWIALAQNFPLFR
jgi:hypothetical protein